tara:strand:+ start:687 stop:1004 length:318 start_codon:yes stop_codon:yes gene_type:complete
MSTNERLLDIMEARRAAMDSKSGFAIDEILVAQDAKSHAAGVAETEAKYRELVDVMGSTYQRLAKMECECDSYNGFTCDLHEWRRTVLQALTNLGRGQKESRAAH